MGRSWESEFRRIRRVDLARVQVTANELVREVNREVILQMIWARQPVARVELARISGLQRSTVGDIIEQLLTEGLVSEERVERGPRGRPPTMLSLNSEIAILVGDLGDHEAIVGAVDLNGRILAHEAVPLPSNSEHAVDKIIACMRAMRKRHSRYSFEGIGVSTGGRLDPVSEFGPLNPHLRWKNYDIKGALEQRMPTQVELVSGSEACLLTELWAGRLNAIRDAVLVTVSGEISTAILMNGQIAKGRGSMAGGFGHIAVDPAGPTCRCGQRGCWELYASVSAALRYYGEIAPDSRPITIQNLLQMAENDDVSANACLARHASYLGRGLRIITAALSPDLILITGDLAASWPRLESIVRSELEVTNIAVAPPKLAIVPDSEVSRLRGAAVTVFQRISNRADFL
jgi:predicted NBD/HSP70 family sugar kinase